MFDLNLVQNNLYILYGGSTNTNQILLKIIQKPLTEQFSLVSYCLADGLRVHTTLPSPKPHAIVVAGRAHAGAAACCPPAASSTGRRQRGHSGRSGNHRPMQSAWNAWPHAGSARTAACGREPAPAGSSDRHTAHSWWDDGGAGSGEPASAPDVATLRVRASSSDDDDDDARDRTAAVQAAAMVRVTAPATAAMASGALSVVLCVGAGVGVGAAARCDAMRAHVYSHGPRPRRRGRRRGRINASSPTPRDGSW